MFTILKTKRMNLLKTKLFIKRVRYAFLMFIIVMHVLFYYNTSYSVVIQNISLAADGSVTHTKIKGLTEVQYDSVIASLPDTGYIKANAISSKRIHFLGVLPYWFLNVIYSFYIYYIVVIVIRTVIAINQHYRPKE